eukprot:scaffold798_cov162-Amphora_coffeaeformis.AAC.4
MNHKNTDALDAPLIALTNQCGGDLRTVLGAFFSFLHRRTDFYLIPHEEDLKQGSAKMGFREGDAEKLLLASFRKFPLRRLPKVGSTTPQATVTPAAVEKIPPKASASAPSKTEPKKDDSTSTEKSAPKDVPAPPEAVRLTDEGLQVPVGNGGSTKRYTWTQTLDECSVLISVPEKTHGKDLDVSIKASSLSVKLKNPPQEDDSSSPVLVDGTLTEKVVPSESTWTLEGGVLIVVLYKHKKSFWSTIIEGDDKIDTTLVDSRRKIDEYDNVTQAQIRKIIFDQSQARKGLSSSDEISGKKPEIPESLPPGVEYINQEKLDKHHEQTMK